MTAPVLKNNEDQPTRGMNNTSLRPSGREEGLWGDDPQTLEDDPTKGFTTGVVEEAREDNMALLDRIFDSMGPSSRAEKKLMRQDFAHAREGHPHSPLLKRAAAEDTDKTLTDIVDKVIGFR